MLFLIFFISSKNLCSLEPGEKYCKVNSKFLNNRKEFYMVVKEDAVGKAICKNGQWDDIDFNYIEKNTNERVMVDIGANYGWYSFMFALRNWTVYAFDVFQTNIDIIKKTICINNLDNNYINIMNYGLGNSKTTCTSFYEKNNGNTVLCCDSSCTKLHDQNFFVTRKQIFEKKTVQINTLDNFFYRKKVGYLKIDVEGFECPITIGGINWIQLTKPYFVQAEINTWHKNSLNCSPQKFVNLWEKMGYGVGVHGFPPHSKFLCNKTLLTHFIKKNILNVFMRSDYNISIWFKKGFKNCGYKDY